MYIQQDLVIIFCALLFFSTINPAQSEFDNIKISESNITGSNVASFKTSPDERWIVYAANETRHDVLQLLSLNLESNEKYTLAEFASHTYIISPDSSFVIYLYEDTFYKIPISGGLTVKVFTPPEEFVDFDFLYNQYLFSPDSRFFLVKLFDWTFQQDSLFSIDLEMDNHVVELHTPDFSEDFSYWIKIYKITEDNLVIFNHNYRGFTNEDSQLTVPIEGGTKNWLRTIPDLTDPYIEPDNFINLSSSEYDFILNHKKEQVIFYSDIIYSVPYRSESITTLTLSHDEFAISPDEEWLVYSKDNNLFRATTTSGTTELLVSAMELPSGFKVIDILISPDSKKVVINLFRSSDGSELIYIIFIWYGWPKRTYLASRSYKSKN